MNDTITAEQRLTENEGLVHIYAHKYAQIYGASFLDDLLQEGRLGIIRAHETFRHDGGAKFSTWAALYIRSKMQGFLFYKTRDIHVPAHIRTTHLVTLIPIDKPITEESDQTFADIIPVPEEHSHLDQERIWLVDAVAEAVQELKPKHREVMEDLFFNHLNEAQIARKLGITREAVRLRKLLAFRTLKQKLSRYQELIAA